MSELTGTAKTIFDEVMDEIEEEIMQALEDLIVMEKLDSIVNDVKTATEKDVIKTIEENYSDDMTTVKKMILGEKLSRVVTSYTKEKVEGLVSEVVKQTYVALEELRNEIIGEVFEETE